MNSYQQHNWLGRILLLVSSLDHRSFPRHRSRLERLNIAFVPAVAKVGILSADEKERIRQVQNLHKDRLRIPRRFD